MIRALVVGAWGAHLAVLPSSSDRRYYCCLYVPGQDERRDMVVRALQQEEYGKEARPVYVVCGVNHENGRREKERERGEQG